MSVDWAALRRTQRTGRRLLLVVVAVAAVALLLCLGFTPVALNSFLAEEEESMGGFGLNADNCSPLQLAIDGIADIKGLSSEQLGNAATIVTTANRLRVPTRGWVIAVATAMQESSLHNVTHGDWAGPDSRGLFQQRAGWGTLQERLTPAIATELFLLGGRNGQRGLTDIPNWQRMALADAAQAVQISGNGSLYAKHEPLATAVVNQLTKGAVSGVGGSVDDPARCAGAGEVSATGWAVPTTDPKASVGSGFGPRGGGFHKGVDIMAKEGTNIVAAAAGLVVTSTCQASNGNCNVPGSSRVKGCGWYVKIRHAPGMSTLYCHMVRRPDVSVGDRVEAGQLIGHIGTSGNSSGFHLHFEVWQNYAPRNPVPFMIARGAALPHRG